MEGGGRGTHDGSDDPHDDYEAAYDVGGSPKGRHQGRADVRNLRPVKGYGEETQAGAHAEL